MAANWAAVPATTRISSAPRRPLSFSTVTPIKKLLPLLLLAAFSTALRAGDITGTVHAEPKAGVPDSSAPGTSDYESRKYKFVPRVDYSAMRDFVVSIEGLNLTNSP